LFIVMLECPEAVLLLLPMLWPHINSLLIKLEKKLKNIGLAYDLEMAF